MVKPSVSQHEDRVLASAKYLALSCGFPSGGFPVEQRQAEIDALPTVEWRGRTLYTITCHGQRGKGHHQVNVPESLLWQLISIRRYVCPYHHPDCCCHDGCIESVSEAVKLAPSDATE